MKPKEFQTKLRKSSKNALAVLDELMKSDNEKMRLDAAKEVLDRAYGKVPGTSHDPWQDSFEAANIADVLKDK